MSDLEGLDGLGYRVTLLLANSAQVVEQKLYILGGGITVLPARPTPVAIAILIQCPWDKANQRHTWKLELLDEDFSPVFAGERPVMVGGEFEAGRPAGLTPGSALNVPVAINFAALPVTAGMRYAWQLSIDDNTEPEWRVSFSVRQAQPAPPQT